MNILITGAAGFVGGFLMKHSVDAGCKVLGIDIQQPTVSWDGARFVRCDVRDQKHVTELLREFQPEKIFHLAAQSYPTVSLIEPRETIDSNVGGTVNLFECLRALNVNPVVVVACSSAEYGPVAAEDLPVKETHALRPLHPYGVSKVGQDLLASQYFANYGMKAVRIRIFNTTGPGKLGDVCSDFTKRAVEIELGMGQPALMVGNLDKRRAIADVRDLVRGLWIAADKCEYGDVYNVGGSGIYAVEEIIESIRAKVKASFRVEQDPSLMRACDEPVIAGDTTKFRTRTGWKPEIDLEATVSDMLNWWRAKFASEPALAGAGSRTERV